MINVSNLFKEELNNGNRNYLAYADITLKDDTVLKLDPSDIWSNGLGIEENVSSPSSFDIGSAIINKCTLVINNIYDKYSKYDFEEAKVHISVGLKLSNGTIEKVNLGYFNVNEPRYNGALITLECLDDMAKFDKKYSESTLAYPATLLQIVKDACSKCNVLCGIADFENSGYVISERPSDEASTFRQVLAWVGQIACKYSKYDFEEAKVHISVGLKLSNGTIEKVNLGYFNVNEPRHNGALITLECLDDMAKFDKKYSESTLVYPATLLQIVKDACSKCNVLCGIADFENSGYVISERPSDEALTFRQVLAWVGQIACIWFKIDKLGKLNCGWYKTQTAENTHVINSISTMNICTDDVVITGVQVTEHNINPEEKGNSYKEGEDGYVLSIQNNKLINKGSAQEIAKIIGRKVIGLRFRPMNISFQNNPTIEAGDNVNIVDYKGKTFKTFVTGNRFTVGSLQSIECGAKSPQRNSADRFSQSAQDYIDAQKEIIKEKTEREKAIENLQQTLGDSSGMFITEEKQPDGSTITYIHDKPTKEESKNVIKVTSEAIGISNDGGKTYPYGLFLTQPDGSTITYIHDKPTKEESKNVIKVTSEAIGISNDGGKTYPYGLFLTGDVITRLLYAVGINADYIRTGIISDKYGANYWNLDNGDFTLSASTTFGGQTVDEIAQDKAGKAQQNAIDTANKALIDYANIIKADMINLQKQVDGQVEDWYYDYEPTPYSVPASNWSTEEDKKKHEGDRFFWKSKGYAYRWMKDGYTWKWVLLQDTDITKALQEAANAKDIADGKRRTFITEPTPPYDVGDLWMNGIDVLTCTDITKALQEAANAKDIADGKRRTFITEPTPPYDVGDLWMNGIDVLTCTNPRFTGGYFYQGDWKKLNQYTDNGYVDNLISDLEKQIDGKIQTYSQATDPSRDWNTTELKKQHAGDIWYDTNNKKTKRWNGNAWQDLTDKDAQDAMQLVQKKAQVFSTTPTIPYYKDDLWFNGKDILTCVTTRTSGYFSSYDWQKKNSYTDDTTAGEALENSKNPNQFLTHQQVFNKLTNNGAIKGIFMRNGQLYINGSYIQAEALENSKNPNQFLTHQQVFNKLTNNGAIKGIFMRNGQLYINGSYIQAETLSAIVAKLGTVQSADISNYIGGTKVFQIVGNAIRFYSADGIASGTEMSSYSEMYDDYHAYMHINGPGILLTDYSLRDMLASAKAGILIDSDLQEVIITGMDFKFNGDSVRQCISDVSYNRVGFPNYGNILGEYTNQSFVAPQNCWAKVQMMSGWSNATLNVNGNGVLVQQIQNTNNYPIKTTTLIPLRSGDRVTMSNASATSEITVTLYGMR